MKFSTIRNLLREHVLGEPDHRFSLDDPAVIGFVGRVQKSVRDDAVPATARFSISDLGPAIARYGAARGSGLDTARQPDGTHVALLPEEIVDAHGRAFALDETFLSRRRYTLPELTGTQGALFVEVAYRAILKRPADDDGRAAFLAALQAGRIDAVDVLRSLWRSPEGRRHDVQVDGLRRLDFLRRLRRVPLAGPLVLRLHILWRLPRLVAQVRALDGSRDSRHAEHQLAILGIQGRLEALHEQASANRHQQQDLANRIQGDHYRVSERLDLLEDASAASTRRLGGIDHDLFQLSTNSSRLDRTVRGATEQMSAAFHDVHQRLEDALERVDALDIGQRESGARVAAEQAAIEALRQDIEDCASRLVTVETSHREHQQWRTEVDADRKGTSSMLADYRSEHLTDAEAASIEPFYIGLEDRFRGPTEEIIRRFEPYLPFIRESGAGTPDAPVIDLGCGRGEWLELLKRNDLHAYGIDASGAMVDQCRARGLSAEAGDALAYLQATRANAFGAVTAMQVVEHLSFRTLVLLIREIRRVLRPGGLLIFETPNPENLYVAGYAFRMDPTHRMPLPPPMLGYLVESQGFEEPQLVRLNAAAYGDPFSGTPEPTMTGNDTDFEKNVIALRRIASQHFMAAPDYAVIARRPIDIQRQDAEGDPSPKTES